MVNRNTTVRLQRQLVTGLRCMHLKQQVDATAAIVLPAGCSKLLLRLLRPQTARTSPQHCSGGRSSNETAPAVKML